MGTATLARRLRFEWIALPVRATGARWLVIALLLLVTACGGATTAQKVPAAGEWRAFEGSWTASGTRTSLALGSEHRASSFQMTGSLLLTGEQSLGVGFRAEVIGFTDSRSGMVGSAVWTDERGEQVFSDLKGEFVGTGNRISGTLLGGTGRYARIAGEYEFQWQYVLEAEDGSVSGRTTGLKGRARFADPSAAAAPDAGAVK